MIIGKYKIGLDGVYNVEKHEYRRLNAQNKAREDKEARQQANDVRKRITKQILTRIGIGIQNWKIATATFESIVLPNNTLLIQVYRDIEIDAHLWALIRTIQLKTIATKFFIYNENDEIDDEATKKIQKRWFRQFAMWAVESDFYGFSLVQLKDILNGCYSDTELIEREYVIQQRGGIKKSLSSSTDLIPFDDNEFKDWLIPIGKRNNLGILHKAAPLVIKKKEVISAWSEAAEIFAQPLRVGKTQINSDKHRQNMEDMLENMGSAAWAVLDSDDTIEFVETSKTDFYQIYDQFINRINSELSKLIVLQTGTTDEKAFVGAAEVHEGILSDVIEYYIQMVEDVTNEELIPRGIKYRVFKKGQYLKADNEQKFTPQQLFDMTKELLTYYKIPAEWIKEKFEVEVEEKEADPALEDVSALSDPEAKPTSIMKTVKNLYAGVLETCKH